MAITGFTTSDDRTDYDYLIKRYKREGLDMFFYDYRTSKNIKLGELKHGEITDYIKYLDKPRSYTDKAWYKIMNEVLSRQRQFKIKKIKNGISHIQDTL
jgi:hypothetical protein